MEASPDPESVLMIRDLPLDMRPRERLIYAGAGALSNAELLAILLRVGGRGENALRMAERLLAQFGGVAGLAQASFDALCQTRGVGAAKATQMKSALEMGRRLMATLPQDRPQVRSPADVANLIMLEKGLREQEHWRWVLLEPKT